MLYVTIQTLETICSHQVSDKKHLKLQDSSNLSGDTLHNWNWSYIMNWRLQTTHLLETPEVGCDTTCLVWTLQEVPWFRKLFTSLSQRRPGLNSRPVYVGIFDRKSGTETGCPPRFQFSPVSIIPPMLPFTKGIQF
jgi:hypothetical protein